MPLATVQKLQGHTGRIWCARWNPQGNLLASCGEDKTIRLWEMENENPLTYGLKTILLDAHERAIRSLCWSPCGTYLAAASFDGTASIWDNKRCEFECNATLEGHTNEIKSIAWSSNGDFIATASRDKSVWIWENDEDGEGYECAATLQAHTQDVKRVCWHPTVSDVLASASYDNTVKLYKNDGDEWCVFGTLQSHLSTVWCLDFNHDGKRLVTGSDDGTIKIWQEFLPSNEQSIPTSDSDPTWKCVCTISGYHTKAVYDVAWCPKLDVIATACGDNAVRIFKEETSTDSTSSEQPLFALVVAASDSHTEDVNSVHWNPMKEGILASASDDGFIIIYSFKDDYFV